MRRVLGWLVVLVALIALGAVSCSGDDDSPDITATAVATDDDHDDDADAHEDDADSHDDEDDADSHDDEADADHEDQSLFDETVAETIRVGMQDISFAPETITIEAGELVALDLDNTGNLPHDFTIERIDADHAYGETAEVDGHEAHGDEFAMHHALEGGHASEMRLRVHEPGEYEFWCTVPGHREAGMIGTLIVQ